ncbi:MAG TPA: lysozyme [Candidatus Sulfopaludibacter sp.]|jgi:lysozyme|nr:lysozyme [Candidatus Sulfopaludibacter sp.]
MKASQAAIDLIKRFESLRLEAYLCPAGVRTIGWGHTAGVQPGQQITVEEAEDLLRRDIQDVENDLASVMHTPLTQGEFDALVSLCFNLKGGARRLPRMAPKLVEKLKAGDRFGASMELLDINRVHGQPMFGLTRRREAERLLFVA